MWSSCGHYKARGTESRGALPSPSSSPPRVPTGPLHVAGVQCPAGARSSHPRLAAAERETWFLVRSLLSRTLPVLVYPLKKCKLLGIVHNHELLEQPLDDLTDCRGAADVQLLDGIQRKIEGRPLVRGGCQVHFLDGVVDGLGPDPRRHGHWPPKFQVHFDETRVGAIFTLRNRGAGCHMGQLGSVMHDPSCHSRPLSQMEGRGWGGCRGLSSQPPTCLPEFLPVSADVEVLEGGDTAALPPPAPHWARRRHTASSNLGGHEGLLRLSLWGLRPFASTPCLWGVPTPGRQGVEGAGRLCNEAPGEPTNRISCISFPSQQPRGKAQVHRGDDFLVHHLAEAPESQLLPSTSRGQGSSTFSFASH